MDWTAIGVLLASGFSAVGIWMALASLKATMLMHRNEQKLVRRQAFFQIWPAISQLKNLDTSNTPKSWVKEDDPRRGCIHPNLVARDVVDNANALELVAVCFEAELVDHEVLNRVFEDRYLEVYKQLLKVEQVGPNDPRTGQDVLDATKPAQRVFKQIEDRVLNRNLPSK